MFSSAKGRRTFSFASPIGLLLQVLWPLNSRVAGHEVIGLIDEVGPGAVPLKRAPEVYARRMDGEARFRMVLTMS